MLAAETAVGRSTRLSGAVHVIAEIVKVGRRGTCKDGIIVSRRTQQAPEMPLGMFGAGLPLEFQLMNPPLYSPNIMVLLVPSGMRATLVVDF